MALKSMLVLARLTGCADVLEFDAGLFVKVERIQMLSGCKVGYAEDAMENFGKAWHWKKLFLEGRFAQNIVMFCTEYRR